jgi:carboxypeptidase C (cathepsin A)
MAGFFKYKRSESLFRLLLWASVCGIAFLTGCAQKSQHYPESNILSPAKEQVSTTIHTMEVNGRILKYTAVAGFMPLYDASRKLKANMFFVAYFKDKPDGSSQRPITFAFNGGPGSSAIWLHLGCLGPKRVLLAENGKIVPYILLDNEYTWLDMTDLVFIDPVGTGFSYAVDVNETKTFFEIRKDIDSVGDFIRSFLTKYDKWLAPKYLVGESYGALRAVGLLEYLQRKYSIRIDGVVLLSSALNFETISFKKENDLPYTLYLPSYAAAAWYHKKLSGELQADLTKTLNEAQSWALNQYLVLLAKGDNLSANEQTLLTDKLAEYTSLTPSFIKEHNFRIDVFSFTRELLKKERLQVGLMDSRVTGVAPWPNVESVDIDPSFWAIKSIFVATFNNYVEKDLAFVSMMPYEALSMKAAESWNWGSASGGFVNFTNTLANAMTANRNLKVFAAMGYYDLTTPFSAQEYTFDHLALDPRIKSNLYRSYYFSGHQIYTSKESLEKLKKDVVLFFAGPKTGIQQ